MLRSDEVIGGKTSARIRLCIGLVWLFFVCGFNFRNHLGVGKWVPRSFEEIGRGYTVRSRSVRVFVHYLFDMRAIKENNRM